MAQATTAPLTKNENTKEDIALSQEFDTAKKYVFQLAAENIPRDFPVVGILGQRSSYEPHKKFKPYQNIVFTSQVVWKGARRMLRYYDGCDSIFIDEQPKEKEVIDQYIAQTNPRRFVDGKFSCFGDEKMLLRYLTICSWNAESLFRTRTADAVFIPVNADKIATEESNKLDQIEEAMKFAREATFAKMSIHASYLGIPLDDYDSGNLLTEKELRIAYRKEASANPEKFIESYGNKSIETKYYIDKALQTRVINNTFNPNKATWGANNNVICDISGLKSQEAIAQRLYEFAVSEEGGEFAIQLKTVIDK